jgi:hypothetical protein
MKLVYATKNHSLPKQLNGFLIRRGYHKDSPFFTLCLLVLLAFPLIIFGTLYLVATIMDALHIENFMLESVSIICFSGFFMVSMSRKVMAEYQDPPAFNNSYDAALNDYAWNTKGYIPKRWGIVCKRVIQSFFSIAFTAFIVVLTATTWGHSSLQANVWGMIFSVIFMFLTFQLCRSTAKRIGRLIKYGNSRLIFDKFPYKRYEPVTIQWGVPQGLQKANAGSFTLRCLREDYYRVGKSERVSHTELWYGTWKLEGSYCFQGGDIHNFCYDLRPFPPITELNSDKPTYWEFEVNLKTANIDFVETYLVPIY